ncbi:hypothetical protein R3P38DRAFT_3273937 [Favolaschia claudopus]|uniref:Uncharacterized protein n=1 Tax=Favolaschia claudopus TaxID=2862362 RepID=A0AAW0B1E1_9AGAR
MLSTWYAFRCRSFGEYRCSKTLNLGDARFLSLSAGSKWFLIPHSRCGEHLSEITLTHSCSKNLATYRPPKSKALIRANILKAPLLCILEPCLASHNLIVTPVVVLILDNLRPILNGAEVAFLFYHPLSPYLSSRSPNSSRSRTTPPTPSSSWDSLNDEMYPSSIHRFLTGCEAGGIKPVVFGFAPHAFAIDSPGSRPFHTCDDPFLSLTPRKHTITTPSAPRPATFKRILSPPLTHSPDPRSPLSSLSAPTFRSRSPCMVHGERERYTLHNDVAPVGASPPFHTPRITRHVTKGGVVPRSRPPSRSLAARRNKVVLMA